MRITEVRIKLMESAEDRLRGFCSITFDDSFVVRDLKIIEGNNGPFVAMPSRKLTSHCQKCKSKNHLRARFCNQCGQRLRVETIEHDHAGRAKLYADIAHPVNAECRELIQRSVIEELEREMELAAKPGYRPRFDDNYEIQFDYEEDSKMANSAGRVNESAKSKDNAQPGSSETGDSDSEDKSVTQNERTDKTHPEPKPRHAKPDKVPDNQKQGSDDTFGKGIF